MLKNQKLKSYLMLLCLSFAITLAITTPSINAEDLQWTAHIPSTNEPVLSPTLTAGIEYDLVITERFWYDYPNNLSADAQYYTTDSSDSLNWTNHLSAPNGHSFLQINGNDVQLGTFSNGDEGHTYTMRYLGQGEPITLSVVDWIDGDYSNNDCHLTLRISRLGMQNYVLTITKPEGGTTIPEFGIYDYVPGFKQVVTASPDPGYSFEGWTLDGENLTQNPAENPLRVIMNTYHNLTALFVDDIPPQIDVLLHDSSESLQAYQNVNVTVEVTDLGKGVNFTSLLYKTNDATVWVSLDMERISEDTYQATIPGFSNETNVTYKIYAEDNNGNIAIGNDIEYSYNPQIVPEFSSWTTILPFLGLLIIAFAICKKKLK